MWKQEGKKKGRETKGEGWSAGTSYNGTYTPKVTQVILPIHRML